MMLDEKKEDLGLDSDIRGEKKCIEKNIEKKHTKWIL